MVEKITFQCSPEQALDEVFLEKLIQGKSSEFHGVFNGYQIAKKSIDARSRNVKINFSVDLFFDKDFPNDSIEFHPIKVSNQKPIHIIGAGPAGLFAALTCLEVGLKPIIFERGKDVRSRRRDLAAIHKKHIVDPNSNYCFGEGGAGTYSDGKLYTRSKKRGNVSRIFELLVYFGAPKEILYESNPHIGTNKLPQIIQKIRACILKYGGEIHFSHQLQDLKIENKKISEICVNNQWLKINYLILATGHSARDIFELLHQKHIQIEAKPFALGVRIEHPQKVIDQIQYNCNERPENLPPAPYKLVTQAENRGVYSFCMCPGGIIAPCATNQNEVVTNGWSPSKRNNYWANSGIVVELHPEDLGDPNDPFVCLNFQKKVEQICWEAAGKTQKVPAQRLQDFLNNKKSNNLPSSSYQPGIVSVNLHEILPEIIRKNLKIGFQHFIKKMKLFNHPDAMLHAPESRTSSPVRIPRSKEDFQHIDIVNLYPTGEGAGYAGGIASAAIDGRKVILAIHALKHTPQ